MRILRSFYQRLYAAAVRFAADDGTLYAAAVAYYVALSFFPLLLVLTAGLGAVLEWTEAGQDARAELLAAIRQQASPELAGEVDRALTAVSRRAPTGGPIGFAVLVISAIAIFTQLDAGFDRIWNLPSEHAVKWWEWIGRTLFVRLKALAMLMGVGGFVIAVMVASIVWSAVESALEPAVAFWPWVRWALNLGINVVLNVAAFTLMYRVVPRTSIPWLDALRGGLLAGILWEIGRQALSAYMLRLNYPSAYGLIGSFIAIMLWTYYVTLVIFYGAEYVRVIGQQRDAA